MIAVITSLLCPGIWSAGCSVDALFGLPRNKAAGISHRDSLHGDFFFGDQTAVDEHVASYEMPGQRMPRVSIKLVL